MTITVPWRRMTLQLSHRVLTDALTFTRFLYFSRYVIRPRVRSYGVISTSTRSYGKILM